MKHATTLLLDTDTRDWLKTVASNLSRQRNTEVTMSEACELVCRLHWKKTMKRLADQRHVEKYGAALKGTKLIRPRVTP